MRAVPPASTPWASTPWAREERWAGREVSAPLRGRQARMYGTVFYCMVLYGISVASRKEPERLTSMQTGVPERNLNARVCCRVDGADGGVRIAIQLYALLVSGMFGNIITPL